MNLLNHYPEIVAAYPEHITQKQFCEVCGVCHKTAYNLERRGEIPYKVVDTPTGRIHHIKLIDALAYLYKKDTLYPKANLPALPHSLYQFMKEVCHESTGTDGQLFLQ